MLEFVPQSPAESLHHHNNNNNNNNNNDNNNSHANAFGFSPASDEELPQHTACGMPRVSSLTSVEAAPNAKRACSPDIMFAFGSSTTKEEKRDDLLSMPTSSSCSSAVLSELRETEEPSKSPRKQAIEQSEEEEYASSSAVLSELRELQEPSKSPRKRAIEQSEEEEEDEHSEEWEKHLHFFRNAGGPFDTLATATASTTTFTNNIRNCVGHDECNDDDVDDDEEEEEEDQEEKENEDHQQHDDEDDEDDGEGWDLGQGFPVHHKDGDDEDVIDAHELSLQRQNEQQQRLLCAADEQMALEQALIESERDLAIFGGAIKLLKEQMKLTTQEAKCAVCFRGLQGIGGGGEIVGQFSPSAIGLGAESVSQSSISSSLPSTDICVAKAECLSNLEEKVLYTEQARDDSGILVQYQSCLEQIANCRRGNGSISDSEEMEEKENALDSSVNGADLAAGLGDEDNGADLAAGLGDEDNVDSSVSNMKRRQRARVVVNLRNGSLTELRNQKVECLAAQQCFACMRVLEGSQFAEFLRMVDRRAAAMQRNLHVHSYA